MNILQNSMREYRIWRAPPAPGAENLPFRKRSRFEKSGYKIRNEFYARLLKMPEAFSCCDPSNCFGPPGMSYHSLTETFPQGKEMNPVLIVSET
jgi:hypothetical protein